MRAVHLTLNKARDDLRTNHGLSVAKGAISMALNADLPERGLPREKWEALFAIIREQIQFHRLRHPEVREHEIAKLRSDLSDVQASLLEGTGPRFTAPGAFIVTDAYDCMSLHNEAYLHELVKRVEKFTVLIQGTVRGGRSSLLRRLIKTAEEAQHRTYCVDFSVSVLVLERELTLEKLYHYTMTRLGCPFNNAAGEYDWQFQFLGWARNEWTKTAQPVSLFLDALECLATTQKRRETIIRFLAWINSLREHSATPPFNNFQVISIYSPYEADAYSESLFHTQAGYRESLKHLDETQCVELCKRYELRNPETTGKSIFQFFHGQPFLTHSFIYRMRERGGTYKNGTIGDEKYNQLLSLEFVSAKNREHEYGRYWDAVRLFLESAANSSSKLLLERLMTKEPDLAAEEWSRLRLAGLVYNDANGEPVIPEYVRQAMI